MGVAGAPACATTLAHAKQLFEVDGVGQPPALLLILVAVVVLVRSLVTPERVKSSLEVQATRVLGAPVMVGTLEVAWYPRVGLRLEDVRIGQPQQLGIGELQISAGLAGLLRRRVDDAEIIVRRSQVDVRALVALAAKAATTDEWNGPRRRSTSFTIASVRCDPSGWRHAASGLAHHRGERHGGTERVDAHGAVPHSEGAGHVVVGIRSGHARTGQRLSSD